MSAIGKILLVTLLIIIATMSFIACAPSDYKLSVTSSPDAGGTVNPANGTYQKEVGVDVTATPASGYRFDHWEGGASGASATVHLVMESNKSLVAYFTKLYTLSVARTPSDGGSVSPNSGSHDEGNEVALIATPAQYYAFNGWGGDTSESSDHITVTMDSNKSIVASFVKLTYSLQANADTDGSGIVEPHNGTFEAGTSINVKATPASGYRFDHWGGSASGTSSNIDVLIDTDKNLIAYFTKTFTLSVSGSPNGSSTVDPSSGVYDKGTVVDVTASALFPYVFDQWSSTNNDSANPTTVTMNSDKSPIVYFNQLTPGTQQTKTGAVHWGAGLAKPTIPLQAGQWVEVGVLLTFPIPVQILDPYFGIVKDFGKPSNLSYTFQAQKTGNYTVQITYNGAGSENYTVTYTIYS